jgi:hypothetical protein
VPLKLLDFGHKIDPPIKLNSKHFGIFLSKVPLR